MKQSSSCTVQEAIGLVNLNSEKIVNCSNQSLFDSNIRELLGSLQKDITSLDLSGNKIADSGAEIITEFLARSNMRHLDLRGNNIKQEGYEIIYDALMRDGTSLESIALTDKYVGGDGTGLAMQIEFQVSESFAGRPSKFKRKAAIDVALGSRRFILNPDFNESKKGPPIQVDSDSKKQKAPVILIRDIFTTETGHGASQLSSASTSAETKLLLPDREIERRVDHSPVMSSILPLVAQTAPLQALIPTPEEKLVNAMNTAKQRLGGLLKFLQDYQQGTHYNRFIRRAKLAIRDNKRKGEVQQYLQWAQELDVKNIQEDDNAFDRFEEKINQIGVRAENLLRQYKNKTELHKEVYPFRFEFRCLSQLEFARIAAKIITWSIFNFCRLIPIEYYLFSRGLRSRYRK
jgi:Leucine Rich repeat